MDENRARLEEELAKIEEAIAAQEALRGILPQEQLEAALAALRERQATMQARLTGSGAIAQGEGAVASGAGGVAVGGDVSGDIHVVNELPARVLELFARQFGFDPAASDATALKTYFDHVVLERHSKLSFLFIRPETGKVYTETDIETVFVPLRMTDPKTLKRQNWLARRLERFDRLPGEMMEDAPRPITLPDVLDKYPCFLLRGKPGCGKTTLLRHIALSFARDEHAEKLGWQGPVPLPLLVSLRNFGAFLRRRADRYIEPQPRALLEYLEDHLQGAGVRFSPDFLTRRLDAGQCFLLLDALDEASGTLDDGGDLRAAVARQVSSFMRHYAPRGNRFGLTSRPRAFQDEGVIRQALPQPEVCDVFDLAPDGYRQLITNLLIVLAGDRVAGQEEAGDLFNRILTNPHLADLAGNPLLCTTLVLVYKYRGRKLPERRVDVLHEIVTLLLGRWEEERRDVVSPEELARLGTTAPTTEQAIQFRRRALVALAWHMQQDNLPELPAGVAVDTLAGFYCDEERTSQAVAEHWARAFLNVAHERSGLFIAVDEGMHAFAHQAFREYLAATYLVNAGEASLIQEVLRRAPAPDEWWEQVVLLAGAHPELSSGAAGRLVEVLLERKSLDYAHLAARCAQDMTDKLPGAQRKKLQDWLIAVMESDTRPAKERVQAGDALALAGDPRPGVGLRPDGLPDIAWCQVPAGSFVMGSRDDSLVLSGKETPQREVELPAFRIGLYPVTNAQYAAFVRDGGYTEKWRKCWTNAGWDWKGDRSGPETFGGVLDLPNHPVVGVSWYEAAAFCNWLTGRLRAAGELASNKAVTLPSEPQWEKAARGMDARIYPWGDEPDPKRANYDDTGIGTTSAVGCFPGGASPYGALDMSGNMWEWCRTKWQESYQDYEGDDLKGPANDLEGDAPRVLRGGAFGSDDRLVRCACRHRSYPDLGVGAAGFGCAWLPAFFNSGL
jgi:formylglycine-generating enzyme required for sulfatase activity